MLEQSESSFDEPVIFVDGGAKFRRADEGIAIGDGDSYAGNLDEQLNPNKDYSDLAYVLASLPAHFHKVFLHGFLGGRRDHEWVNLGEAHTFLKLRHQATLLHFGDEVHGFSAGKWQLEIEGLFSLLCIEAARVTLVGKCQYVLDQATKITPLSSHGLSNTGHGLITLQTDEPVFVVYKNK